MGITLKSISSINKNQANLLKRPFIANKHAGKASQLLTLVPSKQGINQVKRHIRCFDKVSFEFVKEFELVRTNQKYLQSLFDLSESDQLLYSYPITGKQKPYIEKLSGIRLELNRYDYFLEYNLLD